MLGLIGRVQSVGGTQYSTVSVHPLWEGKAFNLKEVMASMVDLTAREVREACRMDRLDVPSCGLAPGHMQANLVVLPRGEDDLH